MSVPVVYPRREAAIRIAVALIIIATIAARLIPGARTIDDAFITFRYSRNLVEGEGFVYNPGVHTLGTTTPLFTLTMAAISAITGGQDFQHYAIFVSALADSATAVFLFLIALRLTNNEIVAAIIGSLWAVAPRSVTFAVGGMETSVNILWMVGAVWWYLSDRKILMGLFAALGFFTRIDAALWIGPLFLHQLIRHINDYRAAMRLETVSEKAVEADKAGHVPTGDVRAHPPSPFTGRGLGGGVIPWKTWLAAILPLLPWFAFSLFYFGSPLPNSVSAKTVAYIMPPGSALTTFIQNYSTPFFEFDAFGAMGAMAGAVIYVTLSLFGLLYVRKEEPRLLPFLIYPWLYLVVFAVANPLIFRWYLAPPMPALMLSIIAGLWSVARRLERKRIAGLPVSAAVMSVIGALWLLTSINGWELHPNHGPDRPAPKMAWHEIELLYQDVGTQLREEFGVTPETRVSSADIGAVGYFSRATIVDTVGLVTPELAHYYPVDPALIPDAQNYAIPPQLILDADPAYLVTMEAFVRLGLEQSEEFQDEYELVREIPTNFYGTGMRVYQRRDVPVITSQ